MQCFKQRKLNAYFEAYKRSYSDVELLYCKDRIPLRLKQDPLALRYKYDERKSIVFAN